MEDNYNKLFKELEKVGAPEGLQAAILASISSREKRAALWRFSLLGGISALSLAGSVPAFLATVTGFVQSGFTEYFALIMSDGSTLLISWQDFILTLAESLPLTNLALFLAAVAAFLWFGAQAAKNSQEVFYHSSKRVSWN